MRARRWSRSVLVFAVLMIFHGIPDFAVAQSQLPDLTIQSLRANDDCRLVVVLRNEGPGSVPASTITVFPTVGFWFNGVNQGQWRLDSQTMYALQSPGAMTAVTTGFVVSPSATVLAHVDYGQNLAEKREDNNTYTQTVFCTTSAPGSPPQAGDAVPPQIGAVQLGPNPLPQQGGDVTLSVRASDNIGITQVLLTQVKPTGEQNSGIVPLVMGTPMNGEWKMQWRIAANSTPAPQTYTIKVKVNDAAGHAVEAQPIQLTVAGTQPTQSGAALQRPPAARQVPQATQGPHVPHPQDPLTPQGQHQVPAQPAAPGAHGAWLSVKPANAQDAPLAQALNARLQEGSRRWGAAARSVSVEIASGMVRLTGKVATAQERAAIENMVRATPDVRSVTNGLTVGP